LIENWRNCINAASASLVFSSCYFNNPASRFGHSLLRINAEDQNIPELLDYAIRNAVDDSVADGLFVYAWKNLSDGLQDRFSIYPYYEGIDADKASGFLTAPPV